MIDLMNKALPYTINIGGKAFNVNTDFRVWMRFSNSFEKWDKKGELDISYLFKDEMPIFRNKEDYDGIFEFAFPTNIVPKSNESIGVRVLDYEIDADYIYSAFLQQYGIDLMDADMHWHKFKALLNGINTGTKLHDIMGYRSYTGESIKNQDTLYKRLRDAWELPMLESEEEKELENTFNDFFG